MKMKVRFGIKSIFALAVVLILTVTSAVPLFASSGAGGAAPSEGGYSITIIPDSFTDTTNPARFSAYQIFKGRLTEGAEPGSKEARELADITWGNGIDPDAFLKALKAEASVQGSVIGDAFSSIADDNPDSAAEVAEKLSEKETGSDFAIAFSQIASKYIIEDNGVASDISNPGTDSERYIIKISDPGYYLVVDNEGSTAEGDARSAYILGVLGNQEVHLKADAPSVDKEISNPRDEGGENKGSSFDIGDSVEFTLTGTLPENYDSYLRYYYKFTDTLSEGLTYNAGSLKAYLYNWKYDEDGNKVGEPEIVELTEGKDADYTLTVDGQVISVEFPDLKKISKTPAGSEEGAAAVKVLPTSHIVIKYSATLNENAVIGTGDSLGNINVVKLTYSNDPNDDGTGEPPTNDTPEKKVYVYTFSLDIHKIASDLEAPDNALSGAGFTLMRQVANPDYDASAGESEDNPATLTQYAFFREVTEISGDIEITKLVFGGWASSVEAENDIEGKAIPEGAVFELITDMDGGFKVYGLGSGTYIFSETTTPNGYNTMDDIVFTIIPKYSDEEGHEGELVGLEVEIDGRREEIDIVKGDISVTEGNIPMTFANDRASSLPGTGGMGRKVFYVLGGVLVIGAFFILFGVSFQRRRPKSK